MELEKLCDHKLVTKLIRYYASGDRVIYGKCRDCHSTIPLSEKYSPIIDDLYRKSDNA